ncbi:MAG: FtsX-like permease family protein [Bacteroidota bacterium]
MIAFKLAIRNLLGAGLRTFLIVIVLSVAYFLIIFMNGIYQGWDKQARIETIAWEVGEGQYWQENFDPYDPIKLEDAHAVVPEAFKNDVENGSAVALLYTQATIYPEGRMQGIMLKGIDIHQSVLAIPSAQLIAREGEIPAIIGSRFAKDTKLEVGDDVLIRWRDVNGTFDATEIRIAAIFSTAVPTVDVGQVWIARHMMQQMTGMPGEATMIVKGPDAEMPVDIAGWEFKDHSYLFAALEAMIQSKTVGGAVFYSIMLALALLAIFDTQILSIFRRQREIGTYISMGMTRREVVGLFTVEGAMHAVLALVVGAIYGIPLLLYLQKKGIGMPEGTDDFGVAAAERIMPYYSVALIVGTIIVVMIATTIVSYMPARKISKMNPNDAIRGKIQ